MKSKTLRIFVDVILIILGIVFLVFGIKDAINYANSRKPTDAELFKRDYSNTPIDNVYKYITIKELSKMLDNGTGLILFGNPQDPWTQVLVRPLNDIAKSKDIQIYYFDTSIVKSDVKNYTSKMSIISEDIPNILLLENGKTIEHIKKSEIYENDYNDAPIEYWTEERLDTFNEKLSLLINKII